MDIKNNWFPYMEMLIAVMIIIKETEVIVFILKLCTQRKIVKCMRPKKKLRKFCLE